MPARKSRVSRRSMGAGAKRLVGLGVEIEKIQLALCVRSVYAKFMKEGAPRGRKTLGRAFAICTASLQRNGFLRAKTNQPTAKGLKRSFEMAERSDTWPKLEQYESILSLARGGRPGRRGGQVIDFAKLAAESKKSRKPVRKSKRSTRRSVRKKVA
jgi:hypothetical protein